MHSNLNRKKINVNEIEDHLRKIDKEDITYTEKLNIGDEVKIKGIKYTVIIKYIDYEIPGLGKVDYAGSRSDTKEVELCIFNQKDIEGVITTNKDNKKGDKEER